MDRRDRWLRIAASAGVPAKQERVEAFDHPCKGTCSGWVQGRERGISDFAQVLKKFLNPQEYEYVEKLISRCVLSNPEALEIFKKMRE